LGRDQLRQNEAKTESVLFNLMIMGEAANNISQEFASKNPEIDWKGIAGVRHKVVHDYAYEGTTLVMATQGTIESERFQKLYHTYDNHKTTLLPCIGLADVIEEGKPEKIKEYLEQHLAEYAGKIENVVLGCTHYPLAKQQMQEILGDVQFFDGANRLAFHLKQILEEEDLCSDAGTGKVQFMDTSKGKYKEERFFEILKKE
jgi:glutamate racemase